MEGERSALLAPRSDRLARWALAIATVGIVLAPYTTVTLPFRTALVTQAVIILLFTLLLTCVGLAATGWLERVRRLSRPMAVGLGLYLATAAMATLVGLFRGNELSLIAGQTLSMGLLPLAALAASTLPTTRQVSTFAVSLVTATTVGALIHFVQWARSLNTAQPVLRLFLPNSVSVGGVSLMALLLAVALVAVRRGVRRVLAALAVIAVVLFIVGTGTRSLWLAVMVGLALLVSYSGAWRALTRPRALLASALVLALIAVAVVGVTLWWRSMLRDLIRDQSLAAPFWTLPPVQTAVGSKPTSPDGSAVLEWRRVPEAHSAAVTKPISLKGGRKYRFSVSLLGVPETQCSVSLALAKRESPPHRWIVLEAPSTSSWTRVSREFETSDGPVLAQVIVTAEKPSSEPCRGSGIALEFLRPEILPSLRPQAEHLVRRWRSLVDSLSAGLNAKDDNVAFRILESEALLNHFASSSAVEKVVGHGLGARFVLRTLMWDSFGRRVWVEAPNYIHNFYAFLLYKTGLLGSAATLAALMLWMLALRRMRMATTDREERALWVAAVPALAAYAVWSLVCPELLNFRMAPIWGFLLGCCGAANAATEGVSIPAEAEHPTESA